MKESAKLKIITQNSIKLKIITIQNLTNANREKFRPHLLPQSTGLTSNTILAVSRLATTLSASFDFIFSALHPISYVTASCVQFSVVEVTIVGVFKQVGGALADIAAALL